MIRRGIAPLLLVALAALLSVAATQSKPAPGHYVLPWNRVPTSWDVVLTPKDEPGTRFVMSGRVIGLDDSLPLSGITVYAYHADGKGYYWRKGEEPDVNRIGTTLRTNTRGEYRIRSVVPGRYEGPPHIHFEAWGKGVSWRVLSVNLVRDPESPPIPEWGDARAYRGYSPNMTTLSRDSSGAYVCRFDLRLKAMYTVSPGSAFDSLRRAQKARLEH